MSIRSYRDLIVWQKSFSLALAVYRHTVSFPRSEQYGITAQVRRAALSIPLNIAEGYGRASKGEYLNQLSVARGSANEVETLILFSKELGYLAQTHSGTILSELDEVMRMITSLRSRLQEGR
jgi:four helix bundle protein